MTKCLSCRKPVANLMAAVVEGQYYPGICANCLGNETLSSGAASYERRRGYEDNAQDTVQPYNAVGPNLEFLRLYPETAKKVFTPDELEELRRKL